MSLDLLKERLNTKPPVSETVMELEQKRKLVEELQNESVNLKNQLSLLENENENLIYEVNKFRKNEEDMVLLKEEEFNNKLQNKDLHITNLKLDIDSLYEQMDTKDKKINYKNNMINESLDAVREAKVRIDNLKNELKLNENKSSKITKKLELQIEENYNEYMYNIKSLQNSVMDNNKVIDDKKQKLENSLKEIKKLTRNIDNLQKKNKKDEKRIKELNNKIRESSNSFILENNTFKKKLSEKDEHIYKLRTEVEDLTDKLRLIENMRYKNEEFDENNPNVQSLIELLKSVSKEKQKMQVMDWNQWKEIPENRYLIELSMKAAEETFKDNNFNKLSFTDQSKFRSSTHLGGRKGGDRIVSAKKELGGYKSMALKEAADAAIQAQIREAETLNAAEIMFWLSSLEAGERDGDLLDNSDTEVKHITDKAYTVNTDKCFVDDNTDAPAPIGFRRNQGTHDSILLKTDSDGVKYLHFEDDGGMSSNKDSELELNYHTSTAGAESPPYNDSDYIGKGYINTTGDNEKRIAEIFNMKDVGEDRTVCITLSIPNTTVADEDNWDRLQGIVTGGGSVGYIFYNLAKSSLPDDEFDWAIGFEAKSGDTNHKKAFLRVGRNMASGFQSGDLVSDFTTTTFGENKFTLFFRFDKTNNKYSISYNDNTMATLETVTDSGTPSSGGYTNQANDIKLSNAAKNSVEMKFYDMRIYDKLLTQTEQNNVYQQIKEDYVLP